MTINKLIPLLLLIPASLIFCKLSDEDVFNILVTPPKDDPQTPIEVVKKEIKSYYVTPRDFKNNFIERDEYFKGVKENNIDMNDNYQFCLTGEDKLRYRYCFFHGGDLFEHSQWSMLQIKKWINENHFLTQGIDRKKAYAATFLHDIGKSGDCLWDMYKNPKEKYGDVGWDAHPEVGYLYLTSKRPYYTCKGERVKDEGKTLNVEEIFKNGLEFSDDEWKEILMAVKFHYGFGMMNTQFFDVSNLEDNVHTYFHKFKEACKEVRTEDTIELLRMVIAISCADISGASNDRAKELSHQYPVMPLLYVSYDPWRRLSMDEHYVSMYKQVLQLAIKEKEKKNP